MQCEIRLSPHGARRWVGMLMGELRRRGMAVRLDVTGDRTRAGSGAVRVVEALENVIYRRSGSLDGYLTREEMAALAGGTGSAPADLVIDLSDPPAGSVPTGPATLIANADGASLEMGIAAALLARRPPQISIFLRSDGKTRLIVEGMPAVPEAAVFGRAYETVAARLVTLFVQAVMAVAAGTSGEADARHATAGVAPPGVGAGLAFVAEAFAEKLRLRLKRRRSPADRWTVGWRELHDDAVIERLEWPASGYRWLPDDGLRYYADPFVFAYHGRRYLFVEEFIYATGRGHLSVADWLGDGWSIPRPILERAYHLSWPRLFMADGEIYMVPETSEARTLELYRAVDFPDKWEIASVLATDISLADATMMTRDDGTWMLAAIVDRPGASSWDGLAVLRADEATGSFQLVSDGAWLVDVRAARPAGDIVRVDDEWRRPVQDCAGGYGSALGIARIDRLDDAGFHQTLLRRLEPDPAWGAIGVHTLNTADGIEVIDINRGFDIRREPPLSRD